MKPISRNIVRIVTELKPLREIPVLMRYAITLTMVFLVFWLRLAIDDFFHSPFLLFIPVVILAGMIFDHGSGFMATFASAILGFLFVGVGAEGGGSYGGAALGMSVFILIGLLTTLVVEGLRNVISDFIEANQHLMESQKKLEWSEARLREMDAQKALLLRDINHRVKNSLQSLVSLLDLAQRRTGDENARKVLAGSSRQIVVMARVFDRLHLSSHETVVPAREFIEGLCADLGQGMAGHRAVAIRADIQDADLNMDRAVSVGLMTNELVTNALKYAFPDGQDGRIDVRFHTCEDKFYCLEIEDDGIGFMPEARGAGSGCRLVDSLARQLGGAVEWKNGVGTHVRVMLPKDRMDA